LKLNHLPQAYGQVRDHNARWFRQRLPQNVSVECTVTLAQTPAHRRGVLLPPTPHLVVRLGDYWVDSTPFHGQMDKWREATLKSFLQCYQ